MKINPFPAIESLVNRVRDKQDADGNSRNQHQQSQQQKKDQPNEPVVEVSDSNVGAAIESFAKDLQSATNGLNASMVGQGPGLKVVLKDGTGAVVRQFTGEEFLKLREAASKDGRVRGKILDQKL